MNNKMYFKWLITFKDNKPPKCSFLKDENATHYMLPKITHIY